MVAEGMRRGRNVRYAKPDWVSVSTGFASFGLRLAGVQSIQALRRGIGLRTMKAHAAFPLVPTHQSPFCIVHDAHYTVAFAPRRHRSAYCFRSIRQRMHKAAVGPTT